MHWLKWQKAGNTDRWYVTYDDTYQVSISEAALELHSFSDVLDILSEKFYVELNVIVEF